MAEGRQRHNWARTSHVMALVANANRDPRKTRTFRPSDFDPFAETSSHAGVVITQENVHLLRNAFLGDRS
jgi:hypothetical protein